MILVLFPNDKVNVDLAGKACMDYYMSKGEKWLGAKTEEEENQCSCWEKYKRVWCCHTVTLDKPPKKTFKAEPTRKSLVDHEDFSSDYDYDGSEEPFWGQMIQKLFPTEEIISNDSVTMKKSCTVNDFVIVVYNSSKYPGTILEINDCGPIVDSMEIGKQYWHWP